MGGSKQPTPNISGRESTDVQARLSGHNLRSHGHSFIQLQRREKPDQNGTPPAESMVSKPTEKYFHYDQIYLTSIDRKCARLRSPFHQKKQIEITHQKVF